MIMNTALFRRIFNIVMAMVVVAAVSSCGGDDDPEPTYPADLLGTWQINSVSQTLTYNGNTWMETGAPADPQQLAINPNSTMTWAKRNASNTYVVYERSFWDYLNGTLREKGSNDRVQSWKVEFNSGSSMNMTTTLTDTRTFTDPATGRPVTAPVDIKMILYLSRYIPNVN